MSWLRRLSRDRNSSKGEQDLTMPNFRPSSSYAGNNQSIPYKDTEYPSAQASQDMLQSYRRTAAPQEQQQRVASAHFPAGPSSEDATGPVAPTSMAAAPDPLTRAFNEAIKPYLDQINILKNQLDDIKLQIQDLEDERADMHAWIDKRGLRAGKFCRSSSHLSELTRLLRRTPQHRPRNGYPP